jgi:hypothetical protein
MFSNFKVYLCVLYEYLVGIRQALPPSNAPGFSGFEEMQAWCATR